MVEGVGRLEAVMGVEHLCRGLSCGSNPNVFCQYGVGRRNVRVCYYLDVRVVMCVPIRLTGPSMIDRVLVPDLVRWDP